MKTKIIATVVLISLGANGFGQQVENDDIYFNSKDRAKMKEKTTAVAYADVKPKEKKNVEYADEINPTDSYSARNVNPEFSARSHAEVAQEENGDYFVNNYKYQTSEQLNNWNNDFNNWYGNSWYNNSYYGNNMYGWNSPYYGSYYNNFGSPWTNPYYQSMLSSSFSLYWGNNWNYGWGVGYNNYCNPYNSMWGSPYASFGYGFGYGSSYGNPYYYNPYGWGGYRNYSPAVVVVEKNKFNTYEMRNSRSSNLATSNQQGTSRSATSYTDQNQTRNAARSSNRTEYYNRNWRYNTPPTDGSTSSYSNSNGENTFSKPTNERNSWNNNSGNSNSRYTPSNSGYDGGGSRSSSSSSSGGSHSSGGGSRSRGR